MARRQVSIFINGREIENTLKKITKEKRSVTRALNQMTIGTEEYEKSVREIQKLDGIIRKHRDGLRSVDSTWNKLVKSGVTKFAGIAAGAFAVDNIIRYGSELFKLSAEMEVLGNKAETVFGDQLPRVTLEAERNATAMGLTTRQYINAAAAIQDLLVPMGFQREEAANISLELTNLSGALSEWTGGQVASADVSKILSKALLGEREELKQLGIAIQEADVKARLADKGLEKLTGTMLQQAKAAATLELITEKTVDAQNAYADNADTLVRRQAELSARFSEVSEKLATALIPVFESLIEVADATADVIEVVSGALVNLSDPIKASTSAFDAQSKVVSDLELQLNPLLTRYDQLIDKSDKSKEEQDELADIIKEIGILTPTAVTQINSYGEALSINADASRDFLEAEKTRLQFVNKEAIESLEDQIKLLTSRQKILKETATTGRGGILNIEYDPKTLQGFRDDLKEVTLDLAGARRELQRLTGDNIDENKKTSTQGPDLAAIAAQNEAEEARIKAAKKAAERERKEVEKNLERLKNTLDKFREENRVATLSEDEQKIEAIKAKYQKELDLILELEAKGQTQVTAQRQELIRLRDEEISRFQLEQSEAKTEAELLKVEEQIEAENQLYLDGLIAREEAERTIKEELDAQLLTEQELQFQQLEEQYQKLFELAEKYGLDTTDLTRANERAKDKLRQDFADKDAQRAKEQKALQIELATSQLDTYAAVAEGLNALFGNSKAASLSLFLFEKGIAAAEVVINLQKELASIAAANANLGIAAAPVIAALSTAAKIRSGIRLATIGATAVQGLTQKKEGGWHSVRGADDGLLYNAQYIGSPTTGMLPSHPVVLASEAGPEYFVSNHALKNPAVLNYVRAIDNITKTQQRVNGGPINGPLPEAPAAPSSGGIDQASVSQMLALLQDISSKLDSFNAVIDDSTIVGLINRTRKLQAAAGGSL